MCASSIKVVSFIPCPRGLFPLAQSTVQWNNVWKKKKGDESALSQPALDNPCISKALKPLTLYCILVSKLKWLIDLEPPGLNKKGGTLSTKVVGKGIDLEEKCAIEMEWIKEEFYTKEPSP